MIHLKQFNPTILRSLHSAAGRSGPMPDTSATPPASAVAALCRTDPASVTRVAAGRWAHVLLMLLSITGSAAYADTDDRLDPTGAVTTVVPGSVSGPINVALSIMTIDPTSDTSVDTTIDPSSNALAASAAGSSAGEQKPTVHRSLVTANFGNALDAEDLEGQRGGAQTAAALPMTSIFTNGAVTDNRAVDVITGSNSIRDGAFANASGLPIVIQNTGANVLIQNATIVNVQLR